MTTFVLVPGAGGVGRFWHLVADRLEARGHAAVMVDLPGGDPEAGLAEYVEIVRAAVRAAGPDTVLVAQSLAGFTAAWVAGLEPVRELILLNAMIPLPGESAGEWWEATGQSDAKRAADDAAGRDPDAPWDDAELFFHDVPLEALAGAGGDGDETTTIFELPWGLPEWPDVLTRVLASEGDRLFPFAFQEKVAWDRLGQDVERVPGGHLSALSFPDQVTDALVASIEER